MVFQIKIILLIKPTELFILNIGNLWKDTFNLIQINSAKSIIELLRAKFWKLSLGVKIN